MPIYVLHKGKMVLKSSLRGRPNRVFSDLPCPAIHPFEAYASPIDDRPITSNRQRERDLHTSGSYDPRDAPASFKRAKDARRKATIKSRANSS